LHQLILIDLKRDQATSPRENIWSSQYNWSGWSQSWWEVSARHEQVLSHSHRKGHTYFVLKLGNTFCENHNAWNT